MRLEVVAVDNRHCVGITLVAPLPFLSRSQRPTAQNACNCTPTVFSSVAQSCVRKLTPSIPVNVKSVCNGISSGRLHRLTTHVPRHPCRLPHTRASFAWRIDNAPQRQHPRSLPAAIRSRNPHSIPSTQTQPNRYYRLRSLFTMSNKKLDDKPDEWSGPAATRFDKYASRTTATHTSRIHG